MLSYLFTLPPVQLLSNHPVFAALGTITGSALMYLANMTPQVVSEWASLGGFTILVVCLLAAIKWLVSRNETLVQTLEGLFDKMDARETHHQNKLDEERRRLEGKWDLERRENLDHREKDRDTREKLADAVSSLASAVKKE